MANHITQKRITEGPLWWQTDSVALIKGRHYMSQLNCFGMAANLGDTGGIYININYLASWFWFEYIY